MDIENRHFRNKILNLRLFLSTSVIKLISIFFKVFGEFSEVFGREVCGKKKQLFLKTAWFLALNLIKKYFLDIFRNYICSNYGRNKWFPVNNYPKITFAHCKILTSVFD